jgi:lipopolysaccharide biosynthesis glycosyltransferase
VELRDSLLHPDAPSMNVVFACDRNYVQHLAVALYSLFENNRDLSIDVYILNADLEQTSFDKLSSIADRFKQRIFNVSVSLREVEGLVTGFHFTAANYLRLFIPEKLPFEKALYLDSDIVVNGSIRDLYLTELDDFYLAAVCEPHFRRHAELEMSEDAHYFNSGVMLINLRKWRSDHIKERVIEFVRRKPEAIVLVDQCGTNSVVNGKWRAVHPKYNLVSPFLAERHRYVDSFPPGELNDAISQPIVIHFTGSAKPWQFRLKRHPYASLYWRCLRNTPFKRYLPEDLTAARVARWFLQRAGAAWKHLAGDR